jgi:hypothetical protein
MTASHPGGSGDGPPDIVAVGRWPLHGNRPAHLAAIRRGVAAAAAAAVVVTGVWAGHDYITGGWRYWAEHRSPLTPGLLCPTIPGQAMPGPGLLAAITDLGRGTPPAAVAAQYGCAPASDFDDPEPSAPMPRAGRHSGGDAPSSG